MNRQIHYTFKKVILIDDDEITHKIFAKLAEKTKLTNNLSCMSNPKSSLDNIKTLTKINFPDAIFIDIYMPLINGWELLDSIKCQINSKDTKVFMLSEFTTIDLLDSGNQIFKVFSYLNKSL